MDEPPANWDQQDDENPSISSTTTKLSGLNVNAVEFIPSFGTGFALPSKPANLSAPLLPKTPPSTPVVNRHTNENEGDQNETVSTNTNQNQSNDQQIIKEDFPTKESEEFLDDQNESLFLLFFEEV